MSSIKRNFSIKDTPMRGDDVRDYQKALRRQIDRMGLEDFGVEKPAADGRFGHETLQVGRRVGLEQGAPALQLEGPIRPWLQRLARAPWVIYATDRNTRRRSKERVAWRKTHRNAIHNGIAVFEGVTVAAAALPYLHYARASGWVGICTSGFRDPAYSEHLCYAMCGAPTCAGRCAGRSSNHSRKEVDNFAVDCTDSQRFGRLMAQMPNPPHGIRIKNNLGSRDVVHFSPPGY